jgi:hypothetical protein
MASNCGDLTVSDTQDVHEAGQVMYSRVLSPVSRRIMLG